MLAKQQKQTKLSFQSYGCNKFYYTDSTKTLINDSNESRNE